MLALIRTAWPILGLLLTIAPVLAQPYPGKPIRIIVPFGPGSASDITARRFAQFLQDQWKQPVVVEDRPGANGVIGTETLKNAAPDGYTLGIATNSTHAAALYLFKKLPYSATEDFEHIGLFGVIGTVALVRAASPFKSIPELVAYAKANPGKMFFGYADTASQVSAELLKARAALPVEGVQYRGIADAMTDLIGGRIHFMFANYISSSGQIRGGKLLPIAVTESQRSALWPEVPTVAETYPDYELHAFVGLAAPRGTPKEIVLKLNEAMRSAMADPAFKDHLVTMGMRPKPLTPEDYHAFLTMEAARWKEYVKTANIEPQ
jgi:tripartite-type tricarboxylate transporter receptor subunit TctC